MAGAVAGIFLGLFFGNDAAILHPIGSTYVRLMEVAVFPYIICSLLVGLGRLSQDRAWRLFRSSWLVYVTLWGTTFLVIFLLSLAIPPAPPPAFIDATASKDSLGLVELLIPANPFSDLVSNKLPAVVIFSVIYGIAIQQLKSKEGFLSFLEVIRTASVTIWNWVVLLAPFGVCALFAVTAGTAQPAEAENLSLYLVTIVCGSLVLALWILPSLISALCPLSNREVIREVQNGLVIAVVTSLSVAALPFIQQATERLAAQLDIRGEESGEVIRTTLAVSYPFAQLGNFFIWLFVLFAAYFYRIPIESADQLGLPFVTFLSGIGSPTSSIDAVAFLTGWLHLPSDATNLYVGMMTITRYPQVVASVMGFAFISFLATLNYYGKLKLRLPRLTTSLAISAILLTAVTVTGRTIQSKIVHSHLPYLSYELASDVTNGVSVTIESPNESGHSAQTFGVATAQPPGSILENIQRSGEVRVGYNPDIIPFSFLNSKSHLVGFDIAYAYQLARDLNVRLRLIPFTWNNLHDDIAKGRFDIAVSAIYVTDDRLQKFVFSDPYYSSPVALIVRAGDADRFLSRKSIEARTNLTIAVFDDPVLKALAHRTLPDAKMVVLPSYSVLEDHPEVNAALWTLEQAKAWAAPRANYTAVVPKNLGGKILIAFLMPKEADQFRRFVNYWLRLQRVNGFHQRMVGRWIDGNPDAKQKPRWSILRNVIGKAEQ
jgi:Na+/H+-dicarboxylate symporter